MLPHFADVALNKKTGNIFSKFNGGKIFGVGAIDWWATRVVFRTTEAPHGLVLFLKVVAPVCNGITVYFYFIAVVILATFAASTQEGIVKVFKWL